ncbi:hypothetical protein PYW08_001386 [Mythimna loreyi]|uniref:Uncharacterized protein n=1 Tax=Mythimna loreyi TaxID=667449 RepID=A0ACC2R847_9NEOP|nr:hypothetical protein PYW08_001386 [Mythimna loreyi]
MGAFGRWQAIAVTVVATARLIAMWNILSILFLTPATEFVCIKFNHNNTTVLIKNSTCYTDCIEYEFDKMVFEETFISNFNLICERAWLASFTQMVLMFGLMTGIAVFGWISDRFGRSKALMLSASIDVAFTISTAFAPDYWSFTVLRFFVGLASGGIMSITSVYILEVVGPQHKELAGPLSLLPDSIALATLSGFAYLATSWRIYLLEFGGISTAIMVLLFFLPETPRWLMANGKADKTVELMTKAAKFNKRSTTDIKDIVDNSLEELKLKSNEPQHLNYFDLFKTKRLSVITMSSCIVWFVTGICYFGINQYNMVIEWNIFIIAAVTGVIQMPLSPLVTVIVNVYGRRASTIGSLVIIGVAMVVLLMIPRGLWVSALLGVIGVLAAFVDFCIIYLYAVELYPTPLRNMGFSLSSSSSKFGAMIAPFVANIHPRWISSLIFAVLPFIAAVICLLLPETKGRKLRDTVDK